MAINKNVLTTDDGMNCYISGKLFEIVKKKKQELQRIQNEKNPKIKVTTAYASLEVANTLLLFQVSYTHENNIFLNPIKEEEMKHEK
jgi:hypothetical protein